MYRHLDSGLSQVNRSLLTMAGLVESAIDCALKAWHLRSMELIDRVHAIEKRANRIHVDIDAACVSLLALQQPVGADLRTVIAAIKINNELERMADLAVNIANNTEYLLHVPDLLRLDELDAMAEEARTMVREVLDAFVRTDPDLAASVLRRDDVVDAHKQSIIGKVLHEMKQYVGVIEQGMTLLFIAKNLERIGDHATNIAEDVIYICSGEDIRHLAG